MPDEIRDKQLRHEQLLGRAVVVAAAVLQRTSRPNDIALSAHEHACSGTILTRALSVSG